MEIFLYVIYVFRGVRKIAKSDYYIRHIRLSVRMEQLSSHWKDFYDILYLNIFRISVEKIQVSLKRIMVTLHEDLCIFAISRLIPLLKMKNVSEKVI